MPVLSRILAALAVLLLAAGGAVAQTATVGAVRGSVQLVSAGSPANAQGQTVRLGQEVRIGDRIVTGPESGLQLVLPDQSAFTIGPNSSMTIDEFVFEPASGRGSMTASVARGTFRFVSGKIGERNPEAVKIKLPVATVGIRGTVIAGRVEPGKSRVVLLGVGAENTGLRPNSAMTVTTGPGQGIRAARNVMPAQSGGNTTVTITVERTGWGVEINQDGRMIGPIQFQPQDILNFLNELQGLLRAANVDMPADAMQQIHQALLKQFPGLLDQGNFGGFTGKIDIPIRGGLQTNQPTPPPPAPSCMYYYCSF